MDTLPVGRVVERDIVVKTYDIDFAGIVSNIVYIRWLEDLRLAMMDESYPLPRALAEDVAPILLETRISYARPLTIQDRPRGRIWVKRMERIRWVLAAEIVSPGPGDAMQSHATAEQTGLFIRLSTRRPVAVPQALRARFAPS
jgi:acyl-CoA thioester hydrolase